MYGKTVSRVLLMILFLALGVSLVSAQESSYGIVKEITNLLIEVLPIDALENLPSQSDELPALPIAVWKFSTNSTSQICARLTFDKLRGSFGGENFQLSYTLYNDTQAIKPGENFCQMIRRESIYTASDNRGTISVKRDDAPDVPLAGQYAANIYFNLVIE